MYIFYYGSITHNIPVQHYSINLTPRAASRQVVPRERAIRVWYYMVPSL